MALEQMEGFELAGRTVRLFPFSFLRFRNPALPYRHLQLRVNTVHEKGTTKYTQADTLDEAGGGLHLILSGCLQLTVTLRQVVT
jgi:RNA-binding protein 39